MVSIVLQRDMTKSLILSAKGAPLPETADRSPRSAVYLRILELDNCRHGRSLRRPDPRCSRLGVWRTSIESAVIGHAPSSGYRVLFRQDTRLARSDLHRGVRSIQLAERINTTRRLDKRDNRRNGSGRTSPLAIARSHHPTASESGGGFPRLHSTGTVPATVTCLGERPVTATGLPTTRGPKHAGCSDLSEGRNGCIVSGNECLRTLE
jgi:hypothetical protein